jgi:tryptophan-rich sensory protein
MWYLYVLVPVTLAIALNGLIYGLGWNSDSTGDRNRLLPPGIAIAAIWVAVFACLGYALRLAVLGKGAAAPVALLAALAFCLAYPFATAGFESGRARVLNAATLVLASLVAFVVLGTLSSPMAFFFTLPLFVWASYVNVTDAIV